MPVAGSDPQPAWSALTWRAVKAELYQRFRSLTDDVPAMSAEIRAFLDARRTADAGLSVLDFGGGSGELVGAAIGPRDRHVIIESRDDRSSALADQSAPFDALIFSHVLAFIADPIGLFAELAAYSHRALAGLRSFWMTPARRPISAERLRRPTPVSSITLAKPRRSRLCSTPPESASPLTRL